MLSTHHLSSIGRLRDCIETMISLDGHKWQITIVYGQKLLSSFKY